MEAKLHTNGCSPSWSPLSSSSSTSSGAIVVVVAVVVAVDLHNVVEVVVDEAFLP